MGVLFSIIFQNRVIKILNFLFSVSGLSCSGIAEHTKCADPVEHSLGTEGTVFKKGLV